MKKKLFIILVLGICVIGGCKPDNSSNVSASENSDEKTEECNFDVDQYKKKLDASRKPIEECREHYAADCDQVKSTEYGNLDFSNCRFGELSDFDSLDVLFPTNRGITVQESLDTVENWLKEIGKYDIIDMKKELRVWSDKYGYDESKDPPYCYGLFYDHISEMDDNGGGAFIETNECFIQITDNGIDSMSDGKITSYLGLDGYAESDCGSNETDYVKSGIVSNLGNEKYQTISGELSIEEGAKQVKEYFEAGTPFLCAENVSIDVPEVGVFRLGDVYGYDYMVRRLYKGIPLAYWDYGYYYSDNSFNFEGDIKHAYVVDNTGVSSFAGTSQSECLNPIYTDQCMLGLIDTVQLLHTKLAGYLNIEVNSVGLVYMPISFPQSNDPEEHIVFPCWEFKGINTRKNEQISVYVDVFTGEIKYYTIPIEE